MELGEQWKQIHQLDQSKILSIYDLYQKPFLVEIREIFSVWIESRFLDSNLDSNNPSHHDDITQLIKKLYYEIKSKASAQDQGSLTIRVKLSNAADMISSENHMDPVSLFQHISDCLHIEREFLRQAQATSQSQTELMPSHGREMPDMIVNFIGLKNKSATFSRLRSQIHSIHGEIVVQANRLQFERNRVAEGISDLAGFFNRKFSTIQELGNELYEITKIFQCKVLLSVSKWKQEQLTSSRHVISIEQIQQWFEGLVEVLIDFLCQLKEFNGLTETHSTLPLLARNAIASTNIQMFVEYYKNQITQLFYELIQHTLLVETQPQQLLKKGKKIQVKVRYLIGGSPRVPLPLQEVRASILDESGYQNFYPIDGRDREFTICGELLNYFKNLQLDAASAKGYVADFRNLKIKCFEQTKGGGADSVLDHSYWLFFHTDLNFNGVIHEIFDVSVPFKIISHGSQVSRAWETLIWNAAVKNQESESVPWTQLAQILNNRFTTMTRKELTQEQMKFAEDLAFSVLGGINPINGVKFITRAQFCETYIPGTCFTFWRWFYGILKLTSEHLCGNKFCRGGPCQDDLIIGALSENRAVEILKHNGVPGTFLLRYSVSQLGTVIVTWIDPYTDIACSLPYTSVDLAYRPLSERILENHNLLKLYPNKDKFQSFDPYILPSPNVIRYLKRRDSYKRRNKNKVNFQDNHVASANIALHTSPAAKTESIQCSVSRTSEHSGTCAQATVCHVYGSASEAMAMDSSETLRDAAEVPLDTSNDSDGVTLSDFSFLETLLLENNACGSYHQESF